jgi:hypothetical protein
MIITHGGENMAVKAGDNGEEKPGSSGRKSGHFWRLRAGAADLCRFNFPRRLTTIGGSLSIGLGLLLTSVDIICRRHIPLGIGCVIVGLNIFCIGELITFTTVPTQGRGEELRLFCSLYILAIAHFLLS